MGNGIDGLLNGIDLSVIFHQVQKKLLSLICFAMLINKSVQMQNSYIIVELFEMSESTDANSNYKE